MDFERISSDDVGVFSLLTEVNYCIDKITERVKENYYYSGVKDILILTDLISIKSTVESIHDLLSKGD